MRAIDCKPVRSMIRSLCLLLALFAGGVEAKKIYHEGDDPQVADCVDHCNVVKMKCRAQARDEYQYCKNIYQQRVREYNWCRGSGGRFCTKPDRCPIMQTAHCTNGYDSCFVSCGGTIEDTRKNRKSKKKPTKSTG